MRFISVREFRANMSSILRSLKKEKHAVLTNRGKPFAVVTATNEKRIADTLLEITRHEAIETLDSIRRDAKKSGTAEMTMREINAEIAEYRRERRAKRD